MTAGKDAEDGVRPVAPLPWTFWPAWIIFNTANIIYTIGARWVQAIEGIRVPICLLFLAAVASIAYGLVLVLLTQLGAIRQDHFLYVQFGPLRDILTYLIVPVVMAMRICAANQGLARNSVVTTSTFMMFLPVLVMPFEVFVFPKGQRFTRRMIIAAVVTAVACVATVRLLARHPEHLSRDGLYWNLAHLALSITEHTLEHWFQVQRPLRISDTGMAILRNVVAAMLSLPLIFISGEYWAVRRLSWGRARLLLLPPVAAMCIGYSVNILTRNLSTIAFFITKSALSVANVTVAAILLGEGLSMGVTSCFALAVTGSFAFNVLSRAAHHSEDGEEVDFADEELPQASADGFYTEEKPASGGYGSFNPKVGSIRWGAGTIGPAPKQPQPPQEQRRREDATAILFHGIGAVESSVVPRGGAGRGRKSQSTSPPPRLQAHRW